MEELLREAFQLGQQWVQDMNNEKEPTNFNDWYASDEVQKKVKNTKEAENLNNTQTLWKKLLYVTTPDLGKIADNWINENPHNNGYAVIWEVIEPEESAYPEIEKFFLFNGLNIGDEAILHSIW